MRRRRARRLRRRYRAFQASLRVWDVNQPQTPVYASGANSVGFPPAIRSLRKNTIRTSFRLCSNCCFNCFYVYLQALLWTKPSPRPRSISLPINESKHDHNHQTRTSAVRTNTGCPSFLITPRSFGSKLWIRRRRRVEEVLAWARRP